MLALVPQAFGALENIAHRAVAALCVAIFAFFFVTVSSRIVGLVGVTSNPTSGMTIATLLGTSAVFLALGWTDDAGKMGALTVGTVVAIAASIAGDMSQDLKTGYLVGAHAGAISRSAKSSASLSSAVFVCLTVLLLDRAYGFGTEELPAPQATLMKLVIEGVLDQVLPWSSVAIGVGIALVAAALRLPVLAFAVGVYLPVATMVPIFLGGLLRLLAERSAKSKEAAAARVGKGTLLGSGLVAGEGLVGVAVAGAAFALGRVPAGIGSAWAGAAAQWISLAAFGALALWFWRTATSRDSGSGLGTRNLGCRPKGLHYNSRSADLQVRPSPEPRVPSPGQPYNSHPARGMTMKYACLAVACLPHGTWGGRGGEPRSPSTTSWPCAASKRRSSRRMARTCCMSCASGKRRPAILSARKHVPRCGAWRQPMARRGSSPSTRRARHSRPGRRTAATSRS